MDLPICKVNLKCPICEASSQMEATTYNGFKMSRCPSCSFVYTRDRSFPTSQYDEVYLSSGAYRAMLTAAEKTAAREYGFKQLWWFKRMALSWLEKKASKGRLLDVGCGPGTFMMVAKEYGWEVHGVEPAKAAVEKAREYGLNTCNGNIEGYAELNEGLFDAVTCFEVLEHVPDPVSMLRSICSLLAPKGRFVLTVPNLDDPYCLKQNIRSAMPPIHINFFNRASLGKALNEAGFGVDRFKSLPIPTSSVRNVHGKLGFATRVPLLGILSLCRRVDGTSLIGFAHRKE